MLDERLFHTCMLVQVRSTWQSAGQHQQVSVTEVGFLDEQVCLNFHAVGAFNYFLTCHADSLEVNACAAHYV